MLAHPVNAPSDEEAITLEGSDAGPRASRPWMPDYGIADADQGGGLLPWLWAEERLSAAMRYWVATVWPDGRPHLTPVWGLWLDGLVWFSCASASRKARNLTANPRCVVSTADPGQPVVVDGLAELVTDPGQLTGFLDRSNAKYSTSYGPDMIERPRISVWRVRPEVVIGLDEDRFIDSPTRWRFGGST
jgi:PPOX class probable F420-dependent enzyme